MAEPVMSAGEETNNDGCFQQRHPQTPHPHPLIYVIPTTGVTQGGAGVCFRRDTPS
ncbi:hypothetical protein HanRHA438_Chr04g0174421 [Helianthus annuus]|nr:hypothetical protein HanLR1_Chr04g0140341 [Helianthus annuus]KAJ0761256.1 hypothetical protein HanOQP8_Chr04g0147721 [Helianthus annuus]KAJ0926708.1 hypothetical protein HanRHA438_Chr04g0174421 [Helianthus annuus]